MPCCTVIIPCFNAERFLDAAIESCLAQTLPDLEVLVVDDGSTDDSATRAGAWATRDRRVRVIRQPNAGVGAARNAGLAAATGEFVGFLDADDLIEPEKLERQSAILGGDPSIGLVLCDGWLIDEDGRETGGGVLDAARFEGPAPLFDLLMTGGQFPPLVPLVRRQSALDIGGFTADRSMAGWADTHFWLRLSLRVPRYHLLPERLCRYRIHPAGMSTHTSAMAHAAEATYASILGDHPRESARALRACHRRLDDLIAANAALRRFASARETALAHERSASEARHAAGRQTLLADVVDARVRQALLFSRYSQTPLVIWGAGAAGRLAHGLVSARGGRVQAFVDSDPLRTGTTVAGLSVIAPDTLGTTVPHACVLVASVHGDAIETALRDLGFAPGTGFIRLPVEGVVALDARAAGPADAGASVHSAPVHA
jgi:hypothetical protein